jgi:hypothetical protein
MSAAFAATAARALAARVSTPKDICASFGTAARTNTIIASVALGYPPDGVAVANGFAWVAIAPV